MSKPLRICLVGATGMVGTALIAACVGRRDVKLTAVTRREAVLPKGARMEVLLAETSGWADAIAAASPDVLVSALGTTWRKAGKDEAAFRAVDYDLVLACAKAAKDAGAKRMIAVSSVGADRNSKSVYLRVKAETEAALEKQGFGRLDILRPALLLGHRHEMRPLERLAQLISPLTDLLMQGHYSRYRSIHADVMAQAIIALAKQKALGRFVHEHDGLLRAIRRQVLEAGVRRAVHQAV
ncbi:MAG: NAD(P)H-binding protein [Novosphingobium sp.]